MTKTSLRTRLLNGQTGDPALLVQLRWQGRSVLLDLGRIDRTPAPVLFPVEAVFVSHAHMDHFMGFDQLLRLFLARDTTLHLFGPVGIADCVQGKLAGYTWNLTDEYVFTIDVTEIADDVLTHWRFAARDRFERRARGTTTRRGPVVLEDPFFRVEAEALDHKIVSVAYAVIERTHLNVRPGSLESLGLRPGPWLNVLKSAVRGGQADDVPIQVTPGDCRPLAALRDALLDVTPGQKVAYVVDTLFSPANAERIIRLARDADVFYCESPFLDEDIDQATRRYHLTARQAGALARAARARRLNVFHFSPRYEGRYGDLAAEANAEYLGQQARYAELGRGHAALP